MADVLGAMALKIPAREGVVSVSDTPVTRELRAKETEKVSYSRIKVARTVLRHAPDLSANVLSGCEYNNYTIAVAGVVSVSDTPVTRSIREELAKEQAGLSHSHPSHVAGAPYRGRVSSRGHRLPHGETRGATGGEALSCGTPAGTATTPGMLSRIDKDPMLCSQPRLP